MKKAMWPVAKVSGLETHLLENSLCACYEAVLRNGVTFLIKYIAKGSLGFKGTGWRRVTITYTSCICGEKRWVVVKTYRTLTRSARARRLLLRNEATARVQRTTYGSLGSKKPTGGAQQSHLDVV